VISEEYLFSWMMEVGSKFQNLKLLYESTEVAKKMQILI
jgi:hypothetical protein